MDLPLGREQRIVYLAVGERRHRAGDEILGVIHEDAGGLSASRLSFDPTAVRVECRRGDAGQRHRLGVGEHSVTVHPVEQHRVVGDGARERVVHRESLIRPAILVPAPAEDPSARRRSSRAPHDAADDLVVGGGTGEVHVLERTTEAHEVRVGVGETGENGAAVEDESSGTRRCAG